MAVSSLPCRNGILGNSDFAPYSPDKCAEQALILNGTNGCVEKKEKTTRRACCDPVSLEPLSNGGGGFPWLHSSFDMPVQGLQLS